MTEIFHYTDCGLDYVYLANGYTVHETAHAKGVSIKDARTARVHRPVRHCPAASAAGARMCGSCAA